MRPISLRLPDPIVAALKRSGDGAQDEYHYRRPGGVSATVRLAIDRLLGRIGDGPGVHVYEACDGWRWVYRGERGAVAEGCRARETEAQAWADVRRASASLAREIASWAD